MAEVLERLLPAEQDRRYLGHADDIIAEFQAGYDDTVLKYHVWSHAESVYEETSAFREELRSLDVPDVPGEFMTQIDTKGHDFGIKKWHDLQRTGNNPYRSPEELTISEGGDMLRRYGIDEFTIEEWGNNIAGTQARVRCVTLGAFTLCAGDMSNTGKDYQTVMKPATELLRLETESLAQEIDETAEIDPITFAVGSIVVVSRYHFINLWIPRLLELSPSVQELHKQQGANLGNMALDTAAAIGAVGEEAVRNCFDRFGEYGSRLWRTLNRKTS